MSCSGADGVLLIHGAHHGPWVWDDVGPLLEPPHVAVSLPGREASGAAAASLGSLTLSDLINSAAASLDATEWNRVVIVGHSLGGAVAAGLAARFPRRVHHLLLIAANAFDPGDRALDGWPAGLRWLPRAALAMRPGGSKAPLTMSARRARRGLANDLDEDQARRLVSRLVPETPGFLTSRMPGPAIPPDLPKTYLITRLDLIHRPRRQAAVAAHLGAEVVELDSGHDPMIGQPAAVAAIINSLAVGRGGTTSPVTAPELAS